jgi:hypothetical protein
MGQARVVLAMGRRFWLIVASCTLLVLLAGCQAGATSTPSQCTPQGVRQVVDRFIDAFNRGDIAQLDGLVSSQQFAWYSTDAPGQRFNAAAYDRQNLMAYFTARHQHHEHLVLNSLDVTYTDARGAGFWFRLTRSADDGLPPTAYNGKGGVQCATVPMSLTGWAMDPLPWSPVELLPEAAALVLITAGIGGIVLWRRRTAGRLANAARAKTNITR